LENENHVLRQKAFNMPTMNNLSVAPKTLSEVHFLLPFLSFFFSNAQENCAPLYIKQKKIETKVYRPPYGGQKHLLPFLSTYNVFC
jgi:hypothetical protein